MALHPQNQARSFFFYNQAERTLTTTQHQWIQKLMASVIESVPEAVPSVEEMAQIAFLSPRQFTRKLQALTGFTPAKFIREIQLRLALQIFKKNPDLLVSEVAYQCGFDYLSTFSVLFKKRFGQSPKQWTEKQLYKA